MNEREKYYLECKERLSQIWSGIEFDKHHVSGVGSLVASDLLTAITTKALAVREKIKKLKKSHEGNFLELHDWIENEFEAISEGRKALKRGNYDEVSWFHPVRKAPFEEVQNRFDERVQKAEHFIFGIEEDVAELGANGETEIDEATRRARELKEKVERKAAKLSEESEWEHLRHEAQELWSNFVGVLAKIVKRIRELSS